MKDEAIKNAIDASVKAEIKELTGALKKSAEGISSLLITLQHEMRVEHPHQAAMTLQVLAEEAARYAVIAKVRDAQLKTLERMQEVANAEYTEEGKA